MHCIRLTVNLITSVSLHTDMNEKSKCPSSLAMEHSGGDQHKNSTSENAFVKIVINGA